MVSTFDMNSISETQRKVCLTFLLLHLTNRIANLCAKCFVIFDSLTEIMGIIFINSIDIDRNEA